MEVAKILSRVYFASIRARSYQENKQNKIQRDYSTPQASVR